MRVLVTGAGGFVGTALVERLLRDGIAEPGDVSELLLVDRQAEWPYDDARITARVGDFSSPEILEPQLSKPVDVVFHLASMPGSQAEAEPAEGDRVNLSGMLALFERLAKQATEQGVRRASSMPAALPCWASRYPRPWTSTPCRARR